MKDFMRKEGYEEDEIEAMIKNVCNQNDYLLKKYVARLRLSQDKDRKILPVVWNRWKQFVGIRKLIKY